VLDDFRRPAVHFEPGERVFEGPAVQQRPLGARRRFHILQAALHGEQLAQAIGVAAGHRELADLEDRLRRTFAPAPPPRRRQFHRGHFGFVVVVVVGAVGLGVRRPLAGGHQAQRHDHRAEQDRVRERGRRRVEALAVGVERVERVEESFVVRVRLQFRCDRFEQPVFGQRGEGLLGGATAEDLVELLDHPRRRGLRHAMAVRGDGLGHRRIEREVEPRGHDHGAQHPYRIFLEPFVGIADRADDPRLDVVEAAHVVDDRAVRDVVEERVDREVAAERVFLGRAERVVAMDEQIARRVG
jgi:hypothetical protein